MSVLKLTCSNCGATHLTEERANKYVCEYCGATYLIEKDARTGKLANAKITGSMLNDDQVYAVHELLKVTGSMNNVTIIGTAPNAKHVSTLKITGTMNNVKVVLLDGAASKVTGSMNNIRHH